MTSAIAGLLLILAQFALMFTNYWFTFGLWPKSWWSFWLCAIGQILISLSFMAIRKDATDR